MAHITYNKNILLKNGKPWFPIMGEFHFSCCPAACWKNEIRYDRTCRPADKTGGRLTSCRGNILIQLPFRQPPEHPDQLFWFGIYARISLARFTTGMV